MRLWWFAKLCVRQVVVTGPRPLSRNRLLNEQPYLFGSNYPTSICNSEMSCPLPIGSVDCQCRNSRVSLAIATICYNECLYMYCSVRFFARAETNNHNHDCSRSVLTNVPNDCSRIMIVPRIHNHDCSRMCSRFM
jgi:hypothetical protein